LPVSFREFSFRPVILMVVEISSPLKTGVRQIIPA
jgi:hypothetical protein